MKTKFAILLGCASAALMTAGAAAAQEIVIEDALATIEWTESSSISVSVANPGGHIDTPSVARNGDRFTVDGHRGRRDGYYSCRTGRNGVLRIKLSRRGDYIDQSEFPVIRVSAPADVMLRVEDTTLVGRIGDLGSADVEQDGCGDVAIGDVAGDARAHVNGSGSIMMGAIGGDASLNVNGSGELESGAIAGEASLKVNGSGDLIAVAAMQGGEFEVNGSGDLEIGEANGRVRMNVNGSGDVTVRNGRATDFTARIAGSGDATFNGHVTNPNISIVGSGDVNVDSFSGNFRISSIGSGDFNGRCAGEC